MAELKSNEEQASDLIFMRNLLGFYLKRVRADAGLSLRDVENISQVSNSEISKVETDSQDCRLESFVRVCAALGVQCGVLLDQTIAINFVNYERRLVNQAGSTLAGGDVKEITAVNLATFASFFEHLLLCSRPLDRVRGVIYPHVSLQNIFLEIGESLERIKGSQTRFELLTLLKKTPLQVLERFGLLDTQLMMDVIAGLVADAGKDSEKKLALGIKKGVPVWSPYSSLIENPISRPPEITSFQGLTDVNVSANSFGVKPLLPRLLKRLNQATAERGKKSLLAKQFGLPLASISQWLSGDREPSGETTLRLLEWVLAEEAQQNKNRSSESTPLRRKTRSTKSSYEKRKSSPA